MKYIDASRAIRRLADPEKARVLQRFFKTGKGEYAEGDRFLGIMVPQVRDLVKTYKDIDLSEVEKLLHSRFNEERLLALLILGARYLKADTSEAAEVLYRIYLKNLKWVNNWNLVDSSAPYIVGPHLMNRRREILYELTSSANLWSRRVAAVSTLHFIRNNDFGDTLKITVKLLGDKHDLMHKACGWMLREVGKRDLGILRKFLDRYRREMPRTMLRYAIERFPERERQAYLKR